MDMNGYNSQDRGLFPSTTITDQIILMWEVLQFLGWKEVQKMVCFHFLGFIYRDVLEGIGP